MSEPFNNEHVSMNRPSAAAFQVAHRIWTSERHEQSVDAAVVTALDNVCLHLRVGISRWIGGDGYRILLDRTLDQVEEEHPVLRRCRLDIDGRENTEENRAEEVEKGFVALVSMMVDHLGRVVGEEMAMRLVEQSWELSPRRGMKTKPEGNG
ncbi:MAG: hypothetical protein ABI613_09490 [Gemmatimonadota bacterium]